jgi:hypothetical protein
MVWRNWRKVSYNVFYMGVLLKILNSEAFRTHPTMYVGSRRFKHIAYWLRGAEYLSEQAFPDNPKELDGFREWLHMHLNASGNIDWAGMIQEVFGEEEEATEKCFQCLDNFLKDLNEFGIDKILEDHTNYEMKRYGMLASSRFRKS